MKLIKKKRSAGTAMQRLMQDKQKVLEAGCNKDLIKLLKDLKDNYHDKYILCRYKGHRIVYDNIVYTGSRFCLATGAFIGVTPKDTEKAMRQEAWTEMEYELVDRSDRVLLITDDTSREDIEKWFADHRLYGSVYLKNPDADILIIKSDPDDILLDVYFDVRCVFDNNRKRISVKEFCEIIGL